MDLAIHLATVKFPVNHSVNLGVPGSSPSYDSTVGSILLLLGPKMMSLTKEKDRDFWGGAGGGPTDLTSSSEKQNCESQIVNI